MKTPAEPMYLTLREEDIERFMEHLKTEGRTKTTCRKYNRMLRTLYEWLPADKRVYRDSAVSFLETKRAQYSVGTINSAISAYNGLMKFLDHRDFYLTKLPPKEERLPELSREEYLQLLAAARSLGDRQSYLLTKLFANTPLHVQELDALTVEAVKEGTVARKDGSRVRLPKLLCRELLEFTDQESIAYGPVFCSHAGKPLDRTALFRKISLLGESAGVANEKVNPRCLHKLHLKMMEQLREEYEELIARSFERQLEAEQRLIGWTDGISGRALPR